MNNFRFTLKVFINENDIEMYQLEINDHHKPICTLFLETDKINYTLFNKKQIILFILIAHNRLDLLIGV